MKTVSKDSSFDEMVASFSTEVQEVTQQLRALVDDVYPDAVEVVWGQQKNAGYGVGPKKMSEHFCYIAPQTTYVNLGFFYGASLTDPDGMLEGTGKALRHVKVHELNEATKSGLRSLLIEAVAERIAALQK